MTNPCLASTVTTGSNRSLRLPHALLILATVLSAIPLTSTTHAADTQTSATTSGTTGPTASAVPRYKPSSRAPAPVDIRTNRYGYSASAPQALAIGDTAPDFELPSARGAQIRLSESYADGPVVLIFYRGHW